jgi:3-hydroxyacyl-CoA dehydrogenase/enoyl-CoA hydratase/3-hydroxybutyryl-CoA epimerase
MAFKNFKVETDADGIALVTWDIPGRSMNVLDETSTTELEKILKQTTPMPRKGRRHHLQQGCLLRRRRSLDARGHEPEYAKVLKEKARSRRKDAVDRRRFRWCCANRNLRRGPLRSTAALGGGFEVTLSCHYRGRRKNKTRPAFPK